MRRKSEARAYNDMLKINMSIENKLELLYEDLIDYVEKNLGTKKYKAIQKVINTFKDYKKDESIGIILRELDCIRKGEIDGMFYNAFSLETLREVVEVVLNLDDMEALLDKIKLKLYEMGDGNMDEREVLKAVLNDKFYKDYNWQLIGVIVALIGRKYYYNYFYRDLEYHLNKIIDNHTYWSVSLEPKVAELEARKEEERKNK